MVIGNQIRLLRRHLLLQISVLDAVGPSSRKVSFGRPAPTNTGSSSPTRTSSQNPRALSTAAAAVSPHKPKLSLGSGLSYLSGGAQAGPSKSPRKFHSTSAMPPIGDDVKPEVQQLIASNAVVVFSKTTCPFCTKAKDLLKSLSVKFEAVEVDKTEKGPKYQTALLELSGQKTVPNIFIHGQHIGGCDDLMSAHCSGQLTEMIQNKAALVKYDYDLAVIGGGSGGLAAAKEAAALGKKVTLFDFVKPSPPGTTWGLGGTCVNVGCIPKKLMHRASILGEDLHDAREFGWEVPEKVNHNWQKMREAVQDHIGSMNWGYRVQLRDKKVSYVNAYAQLVDPHTIKATKKNKQEVTVTFDKAIIATGERPRYPDIPGAKEYCITSDDLFSLPYCPGKTLCVGASYVSLECAGFLAGVGLDTTVMVRSILLRGFDQQCAEMIGSYMSKHNVKFVRGAVPTKIEQIEEGSPGRYRVTARTTDGQEIVEEYNTILLAIGRDPCTKGIGLENAGVQLHDKTQRVLVDETEATNVPSVYAIGDIGEGRPELTPVAIQAGKLLSQRLFKNANGSLVDYRNIATTVFTPLEYGCIGYSEEAAIEQFGEENIEVYHSYFMPLEWTVPHKEENTCYAKLICNIADNERVIGFHVLGPNAGEITQGYAVAMRKGATKEDFDATIGIHPTCSETLTTLSVTKRSGASAEVTGC
ncbi:thioredoxin reductase 1, cytoplasmic isoform X1 [Aplysia californica]|uniref:thioredoxin-disulfide reductase (NADPH) n=1 Tax=Aplysia californica TaxID=6500 RepID=A0ABM0ZVG9_APLCA|nr:thioredoxin reductase 1, cytoplasmic isoform X1 [Aplysia californica]